jgi:hypothetical protein
MTAARHLAAILAVGCSRLMGEDGFFRPAMAPK